VDLRLPKDLAAHLRCAGKDGGARQLRKLVQEKVEGPLAQFLLEQETACKTVQCALVDGVLQFS
jgi:ATP-dependent Clp protease ATP-binding subunit ClpA